MRYGLFIIILLIIKVSFLLINQYEKVVIVIKFNRLTIS